MTSSLYIAVGALVWFWLAYRFYGRFVERRLVRPDDSRPTPAVSKEDGVDFHPSPVPYLWGNHFASIAGAGPIIGPILAVSLFGWGATFLWVCLGSVFIGAIHDYLTLMYSARQGGREVYDMAGDVLGRSGRLLASLLVFCMLLLLITVFMVSVAQSLINVPELVIPTFGLVGVAVLMGLGVNRMRLSIVWVSVAGVVLAYSLIWVGYAHPLCFPAHWSDQAVLAAWFGIISLYCLLASISPIWLILQPRDFISSVKLGVGMLLGFAGIFFIDPAMNAPFHIGGFVSQGKPIWPMLFIIVACGAVSGFHAVVSTGTSSKQLARESDGKAVGFGGMLAEGALSVLVILVVGAGLKWGTAPAGTPHQAALGWFHTALAENWIVAFGEGFGIVVGKLGIPELMTPVAALLGAVMVKSFILTTLDSGTRLGRFLVASTLGERVPFLKGRLAASLFILVPAFLLAVTNSWKAVWQMFGASNQLIAAIALATVTIFLAREGQSIRYSLFPALFMIATALAALVWQAFAPGSGYLRGQTVKWDLGLACLVLMGLGVLVAVQVARNLLGHGDAPAGTGSETAPGGSGK